jgi:hypothetical protein
LKQTIPAATIGLLSQILPDYYTHDGLNGLFLTAFAPEEIPVGSKSSQVTTWLRSINAKCSDSSAVLGCLLGDFMDRESFFASSFGFGVDEESASKLREAQNKVSETFQRMGFVTPGWACHKRRDNLNNIPAGECFKAGPWAVDVEIRRALNNVESDPLFITQEVF